MTAGSPDVYSILLNLPERPCDEALKWAKNLPGNTTPWQAWHECTRGDWLLWLAGRVGVSGELLVLAACDCAETVLDCVPADEDRPRLVIEAARAWGGGASSAYAVLSATRRAAAAAHLAAQEETAGAGAFSAHAAFCAATRAAEAVGRSAAWAAGGSGAAAEAAADAVLLAGSAAAWRALLDRAVGAGAGTAADLPGLVRARIPWHVVADTTAFGLAKATADTP